jgi:hypothetical protein
MSDGLKMNGMVIIPMRIGTPGRSGSEACFAQ